MKNSTQKQVGRDDLAVMLSGKIGCNLDTSKRILQSLFGTGGSGGVSGNRTPGIIEAFLDRGVEVNVRGFGCFRRSSFKEHATRINGVALKCKAKSKLAFRASNATDIFPK